MSVSGCMCISVLIHLTLAMVISFKMLIKKTESEPSKKLTPEVVEKVIEIMLAPAEIPPVKAPPKNAPLTAEELKALAAQKPQLQKTEEAPNITPAANELPRYQRTAEDQLAGKAPKTNLEGERDTIEASNANTVAGAQARPSVQGEKPQDGVNETVDTTFQDGNLEHMNQGGKAAKTEQIQPVEQKEEEEKVAELDQEEMKSSVKSTQEKGDELELEKTASTNKVAKKFLDTQKNREVSDEQPSSEKTSNEEIKGKAEQNKTIANQQLDQDGLKQKSQDEKKKKVKSEPKSVANKKASKTGEKGFRSEAKATVMEGTISRRSKIASENVKATPVGKYMAQISKIVEQEWQRRCQMHADLIQPGTLRIGFMVDENGKLNNISIISQILGSESQSSLTFQALTSVKIPPMPKEVKENQGGDPLEFRYYFRFQ